MHVEGWGSEPHIQFDRSLVEFSPVLPFSPGSEGEVTISNPKPYPIEVYSLSFDGQYLEEEEVDTVVFMMACVGTVCCAWDFYSVGIVSGQAL